MPEEGEHGESGHGGTVLVRARLVTPTAILLLVGFEPLQGLHHSVFAFLISSVFLKSLEALIQRTTVAHGGGDASEPAAAAPASVAPAPHRNLHHFRNHWVDS